MFDSKLELRGDHLQRGLSEHSRAADDRRLDIQNPDVFHRLRRLDILQEILPGLLRVEGRQRANGQEGHICAGREVCPRRAQIRRDCDHARKEFIHELEAIGKPVQMHNSLVAQVEYDLDRQDRGRLASTYRNC